MTAVKKQKKAPADERVKALAQEAGKVAAAAGLKSKYLPGDAKEFIDLLVVTRKGTAVEIGLVGEDPAIRTTMRKLKEYAARGEGDLGRELRDMTKGAKRLYARKTACLAVAAVAQQEEGS